MSPPEENLQQPKDLDSMVSSFLAELEVLREELQSPPPGIEPVPDRTEQSPPVPARQPAIPRARLKPILLIALAAVTAVVSGWIYFRKPEDAPAGNAVQFPAALKTELQGGTICNDAALLLAGRPVTSTSPLYRLSQSRALQKHRKEMEAFWDRIRTGNLAKIQHWQNESVPDKLKKNPVLYPLSGADYLNAYAFFPSASEYLLISLESPGEIPDMARMGEREMDASLAAIRFTVQSIGWVNYLQSRPMREELTNSAFRGVVPLILLFTAGLGHTILDVHPVTINGNGSLIPDQEQVPPKIFRRVAGVRVPDDKVPGIRIDYIDRIEKTRKSITYLQLELRDQLFETEGPERRYLSTLKNRNAILKSAVYLLHGAEYSKVSDFIRGSSDLVIQDDSGIPFEHFRDSAWQAHLFGMYTRPEPLGTLTNPPRQPLLAQRYASGSVPLSFPYGYGALRGDNRSNLILFIRK